MKNSALLFFFFSTVATLLAQTDNASVDNYLNLAKTHSTSKQDSAVYYSNLAYSVALKTKDTSLIGQAGYFHSYYLIQSGAYDEAEKLLDFNITHAANMSDRVLGSTHYSYGNRYYTEEVYDKALEHYLQGLSFYGEANNKQGLSRTNLQLGVVYDKLGKKELAGFFYEQSLRYSERAKQMHTTKITRGSDSTSQNIEVSKVMLQELEKEPNNRIKANVLFNLGKSYFEGKQWQNAAAYFQKSYALKTELGVAEHLDKNLFYIGQSYLELGQLESAIAYLSLATNVSKKRNQKVMIETALQKAYEKSGEYQKALHYAKRVTRMKDSLNTLRENDRIAEITSQFEIEKQADEIKVLEANSLLKDVKLNNQKNILWAIAIGVLLLLSSLFFAYNRHKTKQQLQFSEMTRKLLQMQLNPHFLFNALNGIQFFIKQNDTKKSSRYISNFSGLMRNILENSVEKFISIEEDAETISDFLALQQLVHNNAFSFSITMDENLDPQVYAIPPMFTQPFVENAIIHGVRGVKNGHILVNYSLEGDVIKIEIKDNGKGIVTKNKDANTLHKSMGTSITKQRMENLLKTENYPITLEVVSSKEENVDHGTQVTLTFIKKYI